MLRLTYQPSILPLDTSWAAGSTMVLVSVPIMVVWLSASVTHAVAVGSVPIQGDEPGGSGPHTLNTVRVSEEESKAVQGVPLDLWCNRTEST